VADDDVRVPAGWYPDPLGLPQLRWWDNHAWTEHVSDARQPMVHQEPAGPRVTFAEPEDEHDHDTRDDEVDEGTVQLSRRARRERERLADEPDGTTGEPELAAAFGDPMLSLEAPERDQVSVAEPSPAARLAATGLVEDAPTGAAFDLGTRFDDLLGEPAVPRSAFAHASASAASFVPESGPEPDAAPLRTRSSHRAEPDIVLGTAPAWIITLLPLYMVLVGLLLLLGGGGLADRSLVAIVALGVVPWLAGIVLAIIDGRMLRAQGMERPPFWGWAILGGLVYLVARLMRTVRETGTGFGPLLTFLVLGGFLLGAVLAVPGLVMQVAPTTFSHQAEQSVESDASIIGAQVQVTCPEVPPLLVQQQMVCQAVKTTDRQEFDVTVSLQRLNGWIDWRVDDWGVFSAS
jgi:hypothetical protein